jgi:hypothetical protein
MARRTAPNEATEDAAVPPADGKGTPPATSGAARRGGLGRGLGALIPTLAEPERPPATLDVDINAIEANPYQPRTTLDPNALADLAASIRIHGVIQPLVVRPAASAAATSSSPASGAGGPPAWPG